MKDPRYFLTTPRLGFRHWRSDDLPLALTLWGDPEVTRLIDARARLNEQQVLERLQREIATQESSGVQYWPLFLRGDDRFVGCCGLRPYRPEENTFELGAHLRPGFWGGGYATEACRAVMRQAFTERGLEALFAGHNPHNVASRALLAKLGFRFEKEEYYPPTGLLHPSYLLRREDYFRQPRQVDWRDLSRLLSGTGRQRDAARALLDAGVMSALKAWDAVLCGTVPIDCDLPASDLDIVCHAPDAAAFRTALQENFSTRERFSLTRKKLVGTESLICRFRLGDWPVEIVGQPVPVQSQRAFAHMLAEALLLYRAGKGATEKIRVLKRDGMTTEQAFGTLFSLPGDPYLSLIALYEHEFQDAV